MRELIKSMREATMKSGLMDSDGEKLGTDLLDQQFAVQLSGMPGGLTDAIARQLTQQMTGNARGSRADRVAGRRQRPRVNPSASQSGFVSQHNDAAERVAQATGIPAGFMIGQAGHETGWGRSEIRNADGSNSFNLFGIKATAGWTGKVAEITTTEYVDGEPRKVSGQVPRLRLVRGVVPRLRAADRREPALCPGARQHRLGAAPMPAELQRAGYATDPAYAAKLSRAINTTLAALQRSQQA